MKRKAEIIFNAAGITHLREQTHVTRNAARWSLSQRVKHGELVQLFAGTYIKAEKWPSTSDYPEGVLAINAAHARARLECIAMAQAHPDRVLTGHAAALVHGLPLLDIPETLHLSSPTKRASTRRKTTSGQEFHLNYAALSWPSDVTIIDGARVTTIARTIVDIAATQPQPTEETRRHLHVFRRFAEALSLADASLRGNTGTLGAEGEQAGAIPMWPGVPVRFEPPEWHLTCNHPLLAPQRHAPISSADFLPYLRDCRGILRRGRTTEILTAASPLSDSVFESVTKALLIELRMPFVQQPRIVDEAGHLVARVDFLLPHLGIVIECDGRMKYEPAATSAATSATTSATATNQPSTAEPATADPWNDRRRDFRLTNLGYRVVHLTWDGLFDGTAAAAIRKAVHSAQSQTDTHARTDRTANDLTDYATQNDQNARPRGRWFDASTPLPREAYQRFRDAA